MPVRKNAVIFASFALVATILTFGALIWAITYILGMATGNEQMNTEMFLAMMSVIVLLAAAAGGSAVQFVNLAAQVMTPDPPNPHQAHLDHEYRMAEFEAEQLSMIERSVE